MDASEDRLMHWVLELEKVAGQLEWLAVRRSQLSEAQFNVVRQANQLLRGEFAWTLGAFDEAVVGERPERRRPGGAPRVGVERARQVARARI